MRRKLTKRSETYHIACRELWIIIRGVEATLRQF